MKIVLQRVSGASVVADGVLTGTIGRGYVVLLGIQDTDDLVITDKMVEKIAKLRIFPDENGKTNLSSMDVGGEILIVSQFTLYSDCRKGNRPSFAAAGRPEHAETLYQYFTERCRGLFKHVATGVFGASMEIAIVNDGPFTLVLDSAELGF